MADEEKPGNEPVSETDPIEETGEVSATEGEPGSSKEPDWKSLYLKEGKPAQERANRAERELEELRARQAQSPAAPDTETPDDLEEIRLAAAQGQNWAKVLLKNHETSQALIETLVNRNKYEEQLDEIDDPVERRAVKAHIKKHPGRFNDVATALSDLRRPKLEEQVTQLAAEVARLKANKPDPEKVGTFTKDVSASEQKVRNLTDAEFVTRQQNHPDTPEGAQARMKEQMARRKALGLSR